MKLATSGVERWTSRQDKMLQFIDRHCKYIYPTEIEFRQTTANFQPQILNFWTEIFWQAEDFLTAQNLGGARHCCRVAIVWDNANAEYLMSKSKHGDNEKRMRYNNYQLDC